MDLFPSYKSLFKLKKKKEQTRGREKSGKNEKKVRERHKKLNQTEALFSLFMRLFSEVTFVTVSLKNTKNKKKKQKEKRVKE